MSLISGAPFTRSYLAAGILLRCSHLRGLKRLPGIPSAFPILFLGPTSGFQEMKIGRGVLPFGEVTDRKKRFIHTTVLYLRTIQFITNSGSIGRSVEAVFQILERQITGDSWKCDRFPVSLD
jgi:hypothetical protein